MTTETAHEVAVPDGMTVVSEGEFFAALRADPRDIMPNNNTPYHTDWESHDRALFGRTLPGWKNSSEAKVYMLKNRPVLTS